MAKESKSRFFNVGKRDLNEPLIVEVIARANVHYKLLPPGFGADIMAAENGIYFVEVKNPERPPSKRRLTDDELLFQAFCGDNGIPYHVVMHPEEMAEVINKHRERMIRWE